jgi:hypothetical protein
MMPLSGLCTTAMIVMAVLVTAIHVLLCVQLDRKSSECTEGIHR